MAAARATWRLSTVSWWPMARSQVRIVVSGEAELVVDQVEERVQERDLEHDGHGEPEQRLAPEALADPVEGPLDHHRGEHDGDRQRRRRVVVELDALGQERARRRLEGEVGAD